MARCLIIGAAGQLGRALASVFSQPYLVTEAVRCNPNSNQVEIDLANTASVMDRLKKLSPDIILIAGAYTNVDQCEEEPLLCYQVNAEGPREIARYAKTKGGFVIYYSTDHVFDGTAPSYTELDPVHPLNVYSQSKVEGERAMRQAIPDRHLIIRTSWLYGPDPEERNFPIRLLKRLQAEERVPVPPDQWGSPTFTEDLAVTTHFLIDRGEIGTFHVRGPDVVNRYAYACRIASHFGFAKERLVPTPTAELGQVAVRALRVELNCQKLHSLGGPPLRDIEKGLLALKEWRMDRNPLSETGFGVRKTEA